MSDEATFDWTARFRRGDAIELSEVLDGYLAYQPDRDRLHYLNPTAAALLQLCDGTLRVCDLADILMTAYGLGEVPRVEIEDCVRKLLAERLIAPA